MVKRSQIILPSVGRFKHARTDPLPFNLLTNLQNHSRANLRYCASPHSTDNLSILSLLMRHGFLQAVVLGTTSGPEPKLFRISPISERRIWSILKFRDQKPVLMSCGLISKPSRRIFMDPEELKRFVSGKRVRFAPPAAMGEIILVNTKYGWKEAREAIMDGIGGEVVVRASSS